MLIALIGGRITPSFTRNWLAKNSPAEVEPASFGALDRFALAATLLALVAWVAFTDVGRTAVPLIIAGAALFLRLIRWRGVSTRAEPMLFVLHLGYGWVPLGFLLMGGNELLEVTVSAAPLHALTVGANGTMTLAVMTRATRGHTGRPLVADRRTVAIYVAITLAAILRIGAPFTGEHYFAALAVAGGMWSLAYGLFVLLYFGMFDEPLASNDVKASCRQGRPSWRLFSPKCKQAKRAVRACDAIDEKKDRGRAGPRRQTQLDASARNAQ